MKITILGSMKHADKMVEAYKELERLGHKPLVHSDLFGIADGTNANLIKGIGSEHSKIKKENNYIKLWHDLIMQGDAILVCNYDKNEIKNYIGGNTLMEIGFAYVADKPIYLINPIPTEVPYLDEIIAMEPVLLNGNLKLIKD